LSRLEVGEKDFSPPTRHAWRRDSFETQRMQRKISFGESGDTDSPKNPGLRHYEWAQRSDNPKGRHSRSASERESRHFKWNIGSPTKAFGDDEKLALRQDMKRAAGRRAKNTKIALILPVPVIVIAL